MAERKTAGKTAGKKVANRRKSKARATDDRRTGEDRRIDRRYFDAYAPDEIARSIEKVGIAKAKGAPRSTMGLAFLAGAYIAIGAMFFTLAVTGSEMGIGPTRFLGGVAFSVGLILVVVGGAELFTGNVLLVLGWASGRVATAALLRNWGLVYVGNLVGALGMAVLAYWSGFYHIGGDAVAQTAVAVARAKTDLAFDVAFVRGILCNILVCMAVWLCFAARQVVSKILAVVFPISAFVALGFEHSIANMYFIPFGMLLAADPLHQLPPGAVDSIGLLGFARNLVAVTLGNIVGGGVFVALSYYVIYIRKPDPDDG